MKQLDEKDILRHYLLNLLTIINFEISNFKINDKEKEKIDNLINIASILIANEKIFLNKKTDLFKQDLSLKDQIELNIAILKNEIIKRNINPEYPEKDLIIKVDKFYFNEAFKYLLKEVINNSDKLKFLINNKNQSLKIIHNNTKLKKPVENIVKFLKTKNFNKNEITFQFAFSILKIHKIDIKCYKNKITIIFN